MNKIPVCFIDLPEGRMYFALCDINLFKESSEELLAEKIVLYTGMEHTKTFESCLKNPAQLGSCIEFEQLIDQSDLGEVSAEPQPLTESMRTALRGGLQQALDEAKEYT